MQAPPKEPLLLQEKMVFKTLAVIFPLLDVVILRAPFCADPGLLSNQQLFISIPVKSLAAASTDIVVPCRSDEESLPYF